MTVQRYIILLMYIYLCTIDTCKNEVQIINIMGKRVYNEAKKAANARYIAEKTDRIQAYLPVGYAAKIAAIADQQGTSKAQVLKNAIDMLYSAVVGNE